MHSLRRRLQALERSQSTTSLIDLSAASDSAFAKVTAFVDGNGGRAPQESWAEAMARICDVSVSQLRSILSAKGNSRYQSETT